MGRPASDPNDQGELPTAAIADALSGDEHTEPTATKKIPARDVAPPSRRDRPYLIVLGGAGVGRMFRIDPSGTVIGRHPKADIQIDDEGVSRQQAIIVARGGGLVLEDLRSANGTILNDSVLRGTSAVLEDGDKIRIGSTTTLKFTFTDDLDETFQRDMYNAALRDRLTGAFNKAYLLERCNTELAFAKRHAQKLGLLMLDVDHFKRINDDHGHLAGDAVLSHLGGLLQGTLRTEDVLARYGGEEFCVVCRGSGLLARSQLAERLRAAVARVPVLHEGASIPLTISVGVAAYPEIAVGSAAELIKAADFALLEAKRLGRNRFVVARPAP